MSKNKKTDSNRSFMCHQTRGVKKKIICGNATYIVESLFPIAGPSIADCIEKQVKNKIGEKQK